MEWSQLRLGTIMFFEFFLFKEFEHSGGATHHWRRSYGDRTAPKHITVKNLDTTVYEGSALNQLGLALYVSSLDDKEEIRLISTCCWIDW